MGGTAAGILTGSVEAEGPEGKGKTGCFEVSLGLAVLEGMVREGRSEVEALAG